MLNGAHYNLEPAQHRISQILAPDTNTRTGFDRRKNPRINIRSLMGVGNRRIIRRHEDKSTIFLVDQFSLKHFVPIVAILFLSVSDALLTLFLIDHGAYETNPIAYRRIFRNQSVF